MPKDFLATGIPDRNRSESIPNTKTAASGSGAGSGANVIAMLMTGLLKGTSLSKMLKGKKV